MGRCLVLVLLVGTVGDKMAMFSAVVASPGIVHYSICSNIVASLLIDGALTPKSQSWLDLL